MMQERVKRAATLLALLAVSASAAVHADEGLERSVKAGNSAITEAELGIQKSIVGVQKQLAENAKKAKTACTPNSADPFVPRTDQWGGKYCLPGSQLVNRDYISPSCPGVIINPSCVTGGDKSLQAQTIPGLPGHYYPGTIDNPPDVDCGPTRRLVYVGNDQWACYTRGGHDKALEAKTIRGLPGHYYPGTIDKAPDVDCGIGRQLTYWGVDQWTCTTRGGHDKSLDEGFGAQREGGDRFQPQRCSFGTRWVNGTCVEEPRCDGRKWTDRDYWGWCNGYSNKEPAEFADGGHGR